MPDDAVNPEHVKVFATRPHAALAAQDLREHGWPDARPVRWLGREWVVECNEAQYLRESGRVR